MWAFLYQLASPKSFFSLSQRCLPYLGFFATVSLLTGIIWGLFFSPADYQQQDAFRIIYVHVPTAFMSMLLFGLMAFCAILRLIWRIKLAGIILIAAAEVGATMALIALVTGSLWGKPMWGTWWIWDARLTSELILLLLYLAIIGLNHAIDDYQHSDQLTAILALVGAIDLPIIHYSVYWWQTLHQGATLTLFSQPKIALSMLYPLILTLAGFAFYCSWLVLYKAGTGLLIRECRQIWVREHYQLISDSNE